MSKYLVTGAAGFIGANIVQKLLNSGHTVWTIDNLSTGYEDNIPDGCQFIEGDISDDQTIARLKGQYFDAIF